MSQKVRDIMSTEVITVAQGAEIMEAVRLLLEHHINGIPVVNDASQVVGILCRSDLIEQQKNIPLPSFFSLLDGFIPLSSGKHLEKEFRKITALTVREAMTPNPVSVDPETTIEEVASLMVDRKFHTLPVLESGRLVGIVGAEDVLRTLLK